MSWRFILAILILAAGASAWGGLRLGDWLVAHGPVAPSIPEHPELSSVPVLDANGKPFLAQPPQPLMNGTQGVPEQPEQIAWQIPETSLDETKSNQTIAVSTTTITMDEARQIAEGQGGGNLQGIADVGGLLGGGNRQVAQNQPLQPIEVAPPPPPPAPEPAAANQAWQAHLRQDLQACSAQGFFDRPSCAWAARNRYCEPNKAWGRTPDCPAKSF
jgi:hypothetical protein